MARGAWKKTAISAAVELANRFNPVASDPAAPLKTISMTDSFGPSLMPRASMHQGIAAGLSVLAAEVVGKGFDAAVRRFVPPTAAFTTRMAARGILVGAGYALTQIPQTDDERTVVASARTFGRLAMAGGVGGLVYEGSTELRNRYPASGPVRPIIIGLGGFAGALAYSGSLLDTRLGIIEASQ